jgi:hypothetical protein
MIRSSRLGLTSLVLASLALPTLGCGKTVMDFGGDGGSGTSSGSSNDGGVASRPSLKIDKLDLLFMIDNSASMGDKQVYLEQAVPELIAQLIAPECVDASGNPTGGKSDVNGNCPAGGSPVFPPVHDMHIGIVSSSLGPRLGDQTSQGSKYGACLSAATVTIGGSPIPDHNDDQAHLLNRASETSIGVAQCANGQCPGFPATDTLSDAPEGFLEWFPAVASNAGKSPGAGASHVTVTSDLVDDFSDLTAGVQSFGCGIESQLESWYRFLIQPDPYATLGLDANQHAQWVGVDTTILQERKDFLRPDSAVVIVDLTDENDSEIDVRSIGGQGYYFMSTGFKPPRGTSACSTNPDDPACISCGNAVASPSDPNCAQGPYDNASDWGFDLNLRHVHMKAKYGIDPQFPIDRYVTGLSSAYVPDRQGEYPSGATSYVGNLDCVNPLFAGSLADPTKLSASAGTVATLSAADEATLCQLPSGTRPANAVFYLHIGGVPHQLLTDDNGNQKPLADADWVKILGKDPEHYDYTGIDPHMYESDQPRNGTAADPNNQLSPPTASNTADPINGREWITDLGDHVDLNVDRQYACIFPLTMPRDCTNPDNHFACDCSTAPGVLTPAQTSPLCDETTPTQQDYAKAYPTARELLLARKLGNQGIIGSICPIDVKDNAAQDDPLYGYRPIMGTLLARLRPVLAYP